MIIAVPKETYPGERRVALIPATLASLIKAGHEVRIQEGAGAAAGFKDAAYQEQGARVVAQREALIQAADVILQVRGLGANPENGRADLAIFKQGQALAGFLDPLGKPELAAELAGKGVTAFAMELIPRITRAQSMDALSSMATISGYRAALLGAWALPRMFPMLMTAAGTITPARVLVIGAGVAGLQAIATAHRLGAVVAAYDLRPAAKEQVESLGVKFIELDLETEDAEDKGGYAKAQDERFYERQRELMLKIVAEHDVVITTAAVPGKKAPILITAAMVEAMRPGSVIVDLAAENGGNCELTQPGSTVEVNGVTILGETNLPSAIPYHASQMYAKNISTFLLHLIQAEGFAGNPEDEIARETMVSYGGEVVHPRVKSLLGTGAEPVGQSPPSPDDATKAESRTN